MSRLVTIARFYDAPAAHCAKSALDAYKIPCVLQNDELVRLNWHWIPMLQGIKLHTFEEHHHEAMELLGSFQSEPGPETPVEAVWRRKYRNMAFALILMFSPLPFVPFWMRKRLWSKDNIDENLKDQ